MRQLVQQGDGAGEPYHTARRGLHGFHAALGRIGLHQHGLAVLVVGLADFGDGEFAGGSQEQAYAQALFQQGNAAAELGFGHGECAAGRGKATVVHHLDKVIQVVEVLLHGRSQYRSSNRTN
ncbi:hypothetical protein D3C72_1989790 [compost metagenome]